MKDRFELTIKGKLGYKINDKEMEELVTNIKNWLNDMIWDDFSVTDLFLDELEIEIRAQDESI